MLVDINLEGALAVIAGAGGQAYKRAESLVKENCRILVIGECVDSRFAELGCDRLTIRKERINDASFVYRCGARLIIAATSNDELNAAIIDAARAEPNCLAYSADGSIKSDYSHVATGKLSDSVEVAFSTHGQSPIMARTLRDRAAVSLGSLVTAADEAQIVLHAKLRSELRGRIESSSERIRFMRALADDADVQELIKDGQIDAAQERAMSILDVWDDVKDHS